MASLFAGEAAGVPDAILLDQIDEVCARGPVPRREGMDIVNGRRLGIRLLLLLLLLLLLWLRLSWALLFLLLFRSRSCLFYFGFSFVFPACVWCGQWRGGRL